jgi:phosphatidylglycerol:prolipoprotein diacylglycerol transferase
VHSTALPLGPLTIHWYGVLVAIGFLVGLWTAGRRAPLAGVAGEKIADLGPWLIVGALLGARTLYVISYWDEQFAGGTLWDILNIRLGGLVYYGGLIGAVVACILCARWKRLPLWRVADILAPSIALGYVFGRIGCLMNGCCYGRACALPWAIRFPEGNALNAPTTPVHPTQIYDSLLSLALYAGLAWLFRRRKFDGQVFAFYLMGYAVTRSFVELFRGDYSAEHLHAGLTPAHLVSLATFTAGAVLHFVLRRGAAEKRR